MKIFSAILNIFNRIKQDKIFVYSSHTSFYILISAIPFITVFISVVQLFVRVTEYDITNALISFIPTASQNTAFSVLNEIFHKPSGRLISFSAVSFLWTSSRGVSAIRRGLRFIYRFENPLFVYDVLISVIQMFLTISIAAFFLIFSILVTFYLPILPGFLIGFFMLSSIFTLLYYFFADRKIALKKHLPGAGLASFSWIIFIRVYSFYIENFSNYSYIYGSLTAILLLALWIYFSIIIFFLGAEFNKILNKDFLHKKRTV